MPKILVISDTHLKPKMLNLADKRLRRKLKNENMVVDWCIDHPEYTAKIKVIPKKEYPVLMPCEF